MKNQDLFRYLAIESRRDAWHSLASTGICALLAFGLGDLKLGFIPLKLIPLFAALYFAGSAVIAAFRAHAYDKKAEAKIPHWSAGRVAKSKPIHLRTARPQIINNR